MIAGTHGSSYTHPYALYNLSRLKMWGALVADTLDTLCKRVLPFQTQEASPLAALWAGQSLAALRSADDTTQCPHLCNA